TLMRQRGWASPAAIVAAVAVVAGLGAVDRTLVLWPRPADWPSYAATARGYQLEALWGALRTVPAGRVLFGRSRVPLVFGRAWWRRHCHGTALPPAANGR